MAALTSARGRTTQLGGMTSPLPQSLSLPVKADTICYAGGIAVIDAGYAAPGRTATGLIAVGTFAETVDNSGGAAGDKSVQVTPGVFGPFANSAGGDAVVAASVGAACYIVDDQTVMITATGKSAAGKVIKVDSTGVYVQLVLV